MAAKPVFLLLLWGLALVVHGVASSCNVTCSTDYVALLNCSCSGSVPTHPVLIEASCSDEDLVVAGGSCEIKPPRSWCTMHVETLYNIASIGTMCNSTVSHQDDPVMTHARESSSWELSRVVKPSLPFNVQVANTDEFYNITWSHNNTIDPLTYRVRVRATGDELKERPLYLLVGEKYRPLEQKRLQPNVNYMVDVQAKMCPGHYYEGPWSEWSSPAEWRTTGASAEVEGINASWGFASLPVIFVVLLLLGYSQKPCWQKRLQLITYTPKPNEFFKPLYYKHGGNFKEWVKPVFDEYDYLQIGSNVQKQHDVLQWNNEKQRYSEDSETRQGGHFLHMLQPPSNLLLHFQDGGSSQGTGHSTGHISIHTVTLSGEEFDGEATSQRSINTLRSYQDGENFGSFAEDNREHADYDLEEPQMSRMDRPSGLSPQHDNQISNHLLVGNAGFQPRAQVNEPERVSLDSFVSNEQSEDGYPRVDLDTIDSGFGECSSPGASNTAQQADSDLFHEHKNTNSNYVKQWMICSAIQEDSGHVENET